MKVTDVSFAQTVGAADDKATTTLVLTVRTADIAGYNTMYAVGTGNVWQKHQFAKSTVLDYRHGTTAAPSSVSNQALIVAHGALMLVAWGLCIPLGVLAARFKDQVGKPLWFKAHRAVQTLGLLAMLAGFALIVSFVNKNGTAHWGGTHGKVGLTVVVLGLCQPLNAFIRPPAGSVTMARQAWEFVHKKVGYALVVAAWYNIVLGTDLGILSASSGLSDAASGLKVAADFFFVIVVFAGLYLQQREMKRVAVGDGDEKLLG
jgi:ABC-type proline/glycine betaine transport system permease subunit